MKHVPFDSAYRHAFEVVEQRQGDLRLYPHTDQLPLLWRALNLEFYSGLPGYIARVDQRGDGFHKIMRKDAALQFCACINAARQDELRLVGLPDPDLVSRVTVVQQATQETHRNRLHHFRFYGGESFFPEIRLSGKRLLFTDHVLERFSTRLPNPVGADLTFLLLSIYGSPILGQPIGPGRAFLVRYGESVLAFPYQETAEAFILTTCLTIHQISSLELELPPDAFNLHYSPDFTAPLTRNWFPPEWALDLDKRWRNKAPLPQRMPAVKPNQWGQMAARIKDIAVRNGHGPGSQFGFLDNIPGPCTMECRPGEVFPKYTDEEFVRLWHLEEEKRHPPRL